MDPEPMSFTLQVILIFTLTVLNAFFAAAEMAIVSVNRTRIKQLAESGDRKALSLLKLLEEPNLFIDHPGRDYASWFFFKCIRSDHDFKAVRNLFS